jgi:hypothetical protein
MRHRLRVLMMTVGAQVTRSNREPVADAPTTPDIA